ncbi:MAG: hypothetical protein R3D00_30325 [Bacteroidia bacterium]
MKHYLPLIISLLILIVTGCTGPDKSTQNPAVSSPTVNSDVPAPNMEQIQENLAKGMLGDSTMFPFVYQGEGRSNIFEAYTMRFQLTYEVPLLPMINSMVPWVNPETFSEENGLFITYIRNGREVSLSNPYIQVQYISKHMPNCSSVDSVYIWLNNLFLKEYKGAVIRQKHTVETLSRLPAVCEEFRTPDTERIKGKYMAYAYIDYDKDYLIGLALTTTEKNDFEINLPLFYNIVKSFSY